MPAARHAAPYGYPNQDTPPWNLITQDCHADAASVTHGHGYARADGHRAARTSDGDADAASHPVSTRPAVQARPLCHAQ